MESNNLNVEFFHLKLEKSPNQQGPNAPNGPNPPNQDRSSENHFRKIGIHCFIYLQCFILFLISQLNYMGSRFSYPFNVINEYRKEHIKRIQMLNGLI